MTTSRKSILRTLWRNATPLDRLTGGYIVAFAVGLLIWGRDDASWVRLFPIHLLLLFVIAAIVIPWGDRTSGLRGFVRQCYPVLLYPFFYGETGVMIDWIVPGFLDSRVVAWEHAVFGVDPNVWIQSVQSPLLNELMMLGYFSYYLLIPIVALTLFFRRRIVELNALLLATTTAFVISYIGFALFPVEGPRYFLSDQLHTPLLGWLFVPLVDWVIRHGAVHGGCMPSSHTAVALVVLVWARRTMPRLGIALAPFVFVLFAATVWGRYHYLTDVVVGWAVGLVALWVTDRIPRTVSAPDMQTVPDHRRPVGLAETVQAG